MRASEFILEVVDTENSYYNNIASVLNLIQSEIKQQGYKPEVSTGLILKQISNSGVNNATYQDLVDANEHSTAIRNILKNITPETVTFVTGQDSTVSNPEDVKSAARNPQDIVGDMAKKAMTRRQG